MIFYIFTKTFALFIMILCVRSESQIVFECDDPYNLGSHHHAHSDPHYHPFDSSALEQDVVLNRNILERIGLGLTGLLASCSDTPGPLPPYPTAPPARTLQDIFSSGIPRNGVYDVVLGSNVVQAYFEIKEGRTWLVFQRRTDGRVDFFQDWQNYQKGFGDLDDAFWWGLDYLREVVSSGDSYKLRIDLDDAENNTAYAEYSTFTVGDASTNYKLTVGGYSGTAGDSLDFHNNQEFTTKDRDNDDWASGNCAETHHGAWWYNACQASNLNGQYLIGPQVNNRGITWYNWKYRHNSMKHASMKIRPS